MSQRGLFVLRIGRRSALNSLKGENVQDEHDRRRIHDDYAGLERRVMVMEAKCAVLEKSFEVVNEKMDSVVDRLTLNGEKLVAIVLTQETLQKGIEEIWSYPKKILGFIGAMGAAGAAIYGAAYWIVKVTH